MKCENGAPPEQPPSFLGFGIPWGVERLSRVGCEEGLRRVYLHGIDPAVVAQYGLTAVATPEEADVAIVRTVTPFETLHPGYVFGLMQHEGNLALEDGNADDELIQHVSAQVPTIVTGYLDRPAILPSLQDKVGRAPRQLRRERHRVVRRVVGQGQRGTERRVGRA
ncbi:hypothetical protein POL68_35330 [Stigmatella sp. ncwal1]|uniref:Uncharacterized protein n=1 Tax=Stigmatella ashevillensis TaxID=2995309 RepID=A0ABT5DM39_9BACT|nr:hypothetical protein [Stigmatella ashevillena]MDC0713793.1 hypothetical protein [Stigmatella ashevillena]